MLRTDVIARMLLARIVALGSMSENEALDALDARAPGRGHEVVAWAQQAGMIRRVAGTNSEPARLEART